jgi:thiol-disulfide isomerase/thioredoxin
MNERVRDSRTGKVIQLRNTWPIQRAEVERAPVLLLLWSTSCTPCIKELPELDRLRQSSGIFVLGILDELPTPTNQKNLGDLIHPYATLSHQYYVTDEHLKASTFNDIPGFRDSIPAFRLIDWRGSTLATGRGVITDSANSAAIAAALKRFESDQDLEIKKEADGRVSEPKGPQTGRRGSGISGRQYFERCAQSNGLTFDALTADMTRFYIAKGAKPADFEGLLYSAWSVLHAPGSITSGARLPDHIRIWIDVTCPVCEGAVKTVQKTSSLYRPPLSIEYIAIAGHDKESERAANALAVIRARSPERYQEAVTQFIRVVPEHPDALTDLIEDYLGDSRLESVPEWSRVHDRIQPPPEFAARNVPPPYGEYRGVGFYRDPAPPFGALAFDPFSGEAPLMFALWIIDNCERK